MYNKEIYRKPNFYCIIKLLKKPKRMKLKKLMLLIVMLFAIANTSYAHNLEPLHVDGRYLKNPNGDIVTLHGYMTSLDSWFQAEDFKFDNYDFQTATINKKAAIDSVLATGWKMDYVRFIFPDYYCFEKGNGYKGFNLGLFKKYLDEFCLPLIDYFHKKGIYTILLPPASSPIVIGEGDEFQQFLLLIWDCISNHPRIKNNPGIMFELANEPVNFNCKYSCYDGLGSYALNSRTPFKEVKDYWQPIVDKIRSHCNNIIYVPGMQWQSDFTGFADYPVMGDNIGYAIHWYPFWWGNMRKDWEEHVFPVAYMAPFVITETGWGIADATEGTTTNFGNPLKEIVDDLGNVSWNCWLPYEDFYYLVNDETSENERAKIANNPEVYYKPLYQWWNDYAHTKVMPTNQLKAKRVSFNDFPTTVSPGKYWLAKIKAEFSNGLSWDVSGDAEYTVSDESVLTIKNGVIRAWKEGTATVGVTYTDGTGQTFSRQFSITSALFPLTNQGFNPDLTTNGNSFDESNGTFSSETWTMGGWTFGEGLDLSSYQYLVFQLHEPPQFGASAHIWDVYQYWDDENGGWNSACDPISEQPGFDFGSSTELVINLQNLKNKSGQLLDLSHICRVAINVYGGTVRIKNVFLSNDGITPAPYTGEPVVVYADNKTIYYGDNLPDLTYSVSGYGNIGTPKITTTANSASPVGTYPITFGQGTVSDEHTNFQDGNVYILPAPLEVSINDSIINEGEAPTHFTYSGFKNGDTEENALTVHPVAIALENSTHDIVTAVNVLPAGSYLLSGREGKADNYELYYNANTLTVKELPIDGTDLTDHVGTTPGDWHAGGVAGFPVKISDGREESLCDTYETTTADVGERMWQEIKNLPNGEYVVEVFANAIYKSDQGHIESSVIEGADDVAYVEANGKRTYLKARISENIPWSHFYRINTKVTNGTLRISLVVEKPGTNWHSIQIKRLVYLGKYVNQQQYAAAQKTIEYEKKYGIYTTFNGKEEGTRRYYLTTEGYLTTEPTEACLFTFHKTEGDGLYCSPGWKLDACFSNPKLSENGGATGNLNPQGHILTDVGNNRIDWEGQVWYLDDNGRYAVRATNAVSNEWGAATFWSVLDTNSDGQPEADYSWMPTFVWQLESESNLTVTVTADNKTMIYGDEVPELTYTIDGSAFDGTPQLTTAATSKSSVGTYPILVEKGTVEDKIVTCVKGTLTITKAPLKVGVKDETITEGDAIPTFTLTYDGFRNNDNEATAFTTKPRATTTATSSSPAGSYPIKVSGGKAKNYELTYQSGKLTVTVPSGIAELMKSGRPFDVYDVKGRKVRNQVTTLKDLEKGIYIINGKKVVVR